MKSGASTLMSARSARSLSVSAGSDDVSLGRLMPLRERTVPPTRTQQMRQSRRTSVATRAMVPSATKTGSPARTLSNNDGSPSGMPPAPIATCRPPRR